MAKYRHGFVPVQQAITNRLREENRSEGMTFPLDLSTHAFIMNFKKYTYRAQDTTAQADQDTKISIALPVPKEIREEFRVNFNATELGGMGQVADELAKLDITSSDALLESINEAITGINIDSNATVGEKIALAGQMGGQASAAGVAGLLAGKGAALKAVSGVASTLGLGSVQGAISALSGTAINPMETAVLQGIPLRSHTFSWKLAPRNREEDDMLANIIMTIKKEMSPSLGGLGEDGNFQFRYPKVIHAHYEGSTSTNQIRFKPMVIQNFTTDYAADGVSFFKDTGNPVSYNLQMQCLEIDIITREDFE